ncbi:MAG: hypothetical protein HQ558_06110 [Candidatus Omnitrophica bacterium]|nr:hypothetical protein [Candidatus Omnitrophota bacterium]
MSIINDALKKAREDRDKNLSEPQDQQNLNGTEPKEDTQNKEAPKWSIARSLGLHADKKILLRNIAFVVIVGILASYWFATKKKPQTGEPVSQQPATAQPTASAAKEPAKPAFSPPSATKQKEQPQAPPVTLDPADFTVTGIVYGDGAPMTIINGGVYEVGDEISGAKVLKAENDTVVLQKGNQRIILTVE